MNTKIKYTLGVNQVESHRLIESRYYATKGRLFQNVKILKTCQRAFTAYRRLQAIKKGTFFKNTLIYQIDCILRFYKS
ncbi:hypothetical protein J2W55_003729 [Mucilaginibacter pocheonensis]|uniref:Transposase n=1 Tax=Mucilaginibacter pocheonensis TaxID=398050 RepID=A0ABU1TGE0_9SPHI|nr:hypothetical protein [Mucilaginibacter pocheonensis]